MKKIDKEWCMSSFLAFRYVANQDTIFGEGIEHVECKLVPEEDKIPCESIDDIKNSIKTQLELVDKSKTALMLSGGIDSGILASYMPEGAVAYTVSSPAEASLIEIERAKRVCDKYGMEHRVVNIGWEDYLSCIDDLMKHDGCPVFANEPQVYTIAQKIKSDGFDTVVIGDSADMAFGGMDLMLSKDWTFDEWIDRYTFVRPENVLKNPKSVLNVYEQYRIDGNMVDYIRFINEVFSISSSSAYINAFDLVGLNYIDPYVCLKMAKPLDLNRVRNGDSKYMLRELYRERFPGFDVPEKIAMARAVDVWLSNWGGPERDEFINGCTLGMSGEQKFLIYSLERFMNLMKL